LERIEYRMTSLERIEYRMTSLERIEYRMIKVGENSVQDDEGWRGLITG